MTPTEPLLAAGYTRQSKGKERSIAEQEASIRETCAQQGWPVSEIYSDTVSASRFSDRERAGWERLLTDLKADAFGVLVLWEASRGDRDLETWVAFLARCRDHDVRIHVIAHDHTYNMASLRDWKALAEEGIDSATESEKTSLRINRTMKSEAAKGKPHGRVTYGYKRVYDKDTRELKEQIPHPEQAPVVKEIITRIGGGVPIISITRDLNRRGVPAPGSAVAWTRWTVRRTALNPAYIGQRSYNGALFDAMWPPLVNPVVFEAARRVLEDPARLTTRPGRARWLLSHIAVCDVCGATLQALPNGTGGRSSYPMYRCSGQACVFMRMDWLDAYVTGRVRRLMSTVTFTGNDGEALKLRSEAAKLQSQLDAKARACAREELSDRAYMLMEAELLPKIAKLAKAADAVAVPLPMRGISMDDWDNLDLAVRREVIRAAYEIRVRTRQTHARGFDKDRVIMNLRLGDQIAQPQAAEENG